MADPPTAYLSNFIHVDLNASMPLDMDLRGCHGRSSAPLDLQALQVDSQATFHLKANFSFHTPARQPTSTTKSGFTQALKLALVYVYAVHWKPHVHRDRLCRKIWHCCKPRIEPQQEWSSPVVRNLSHYSTRLKDCCLPAWLETTESSFRMGVGVGRRTK